jgi:hypothetical protein
MIAPNTIPKEINNFITDFISPSSLPVPGKGILKIATGTANFVPGLFLKFLPSPLKETDVNQMISFGAKQLLTGSFQFAVEAGALIGLYTYSAYHFPGGTLNYNNY